MISLLNESYYWTDDISLYQKRVCYKILDYFQIILMSEEYRFSGILVGVADNVEESSQIFLHV